MRYVATIGKVIIGIGVWFALRREASRQLSSAFTEFGSLFETDIPTAGAIDATRTVERVFDAAELAL